MRNNRWLGGLLAVLMLVSALALAACGGDGNKKSGGGSAIVSNSANKKTKIVVGSKNFTEQKVLGEIFAQGLTAAGYKVSKQLNLGDEKVQFKALKARKIDAAPEYTGTALGSLFGVASNKIPKSSATAFNQAKADYAKQGFTAYPPTPFTSSNEVGVRQETARKYKLSKISDLKPVAGKLTLYGTPECRQRLDCLLGLQKVYGLKFKKFVPVAIDLRHEVLKKGQADVSIVFTTDPQNKRDKVVLLKDDRSMFPPYNSTFVVRDKTVKQAGPDLAKTVAKLEKGLTAPAMQELNARVDLDKKTPAEVAGEYLKEQGLVK
ncbi:MAG: glycine betaine ABC transporter substrate-binding protein [Thermoleophilaceae bacterium]